jgi:hypothetical protein
LRLATIGLLVAAAPATVLAHPTRTVTKIYYGINNDTIVRRANIDGSQQEELYTTPGGSTIDIAVDTLEQRICFPSNEAGGIQRSHLDGSNPELALAVPMTGPLSIDVLTVDSRNRQLYWSDSSPDRLFQTHSGASAIWRSNLDGSRRELLVEGLPRVTAIEVDPEGGNFYWVLHGPHPPHHAG